MKKRYFITLFLLLLSVPTHAQLLQGVVGGSGVTLSCNTTIPVVSQWTTDDNRNILNQTMQQVIQNSSSIQICQIAIITSNAGTQTTSNYFQIWNAAGSVQYGGNSSSVNFLQAEGGGVTRTFTWSSNYPNPTGDYVIRIIPSIDSEHSWCMITDGTVYIDTNYDLWRNGIDLNNDATFKIYTLQ